ncbi:MAG: hypothetical protein JJV98_05340 [Desulfosarcina sp.]|nr:hypothetical protein [Desulfobacterales bacterium]
MSIQPQGEEIRKAVKWVSEERQADAAVNLGRLVEQAAVKFDLNPREVEFLTRFVKGEMS